MVGFCENCHDMVNCSIKKVKKANNIKGKEINYIGKEVYCAECGSEIFMAEIRDYNLKMLEQAFRDPACKEGVNL